MFKIFKEAWHDFEQIESDWYDKVDDLKRRKNAALAEAPREVVYLRRGALGSHEVDPAAVTEHDLFSGDVLVRFRLIISNTYADEQDALDRSRPGLITTYLSALGRRSTNRLQKVGEWAAESPLVLGANAIEAIAKFLEKPKKK